MVQLSMPSRPAGRNRPALLPSRPTAAARSRILAGALLALVLLGAAAPAAASDERCDLRAVGEAYEIGRFQEVLATLDRCLDSGFSPEENIEGYALLAKTYLALDRLDEAADAVRRLLSLNPTFTPSATDPPWFVRQVRAAEGGVAEMQVVSVSKTAESLRLAPATVTVVTADQVARRGYLDLEQVLHDLPGFDVSRGNGDIYSLFYPRGYRSRNDRILFLVDGVEQNDLWGNVAYLSRQYPLSNLDRIEVIYGPASTMYGPNAFVGVINVITREPEAMVAEEERLGVRVEVGGGTWESRWADATVAGHTRSGSVSYSLTGRLYRSDEQDLSGFAEWDYDPAFYDGVDYGNRLSLSGDEASAFFGGLSAAQQELLRSSPYVSVTESGGAATALLLTPAGAARARQLDQAALERSVGGRPVAFSDRTDDWLVYGKLKVANFTLGFGSWRREEGFTPWYTDNLYPGADNGVLWIPEQTFFYLKYSRDLGRRLGLTLFSQFRRHTLADGTQEQQLRNYATEDLDLLDLAMEVPSFWRTTAFDLLSRQFKTEATLRWSPSARFDLVGGVEARSGIIQGDFMLTVAGSEKPEENRADAEGQFFDQLDLGAFVQASYRHRDRWRFVVGSRLDYNEVRGGNGYGTVFNPRLAAIYSPGDWVFKAIYAEAFKDASNFNRYAIAPGFRDLPSPNLEPEKVKNFELAAGWHPRPELAVEAAAYRADYSNAVEARQVPFGTGTTFQNQAVGSLEITGLQASLSWRYRRYDLDANYTYADPRRTSRADPEGRPRPEVRIGDIAEHRINLGLSARFLDRLDAHLRANYVGDRRTGAGTSVDGNPRREIGSYLVLHSALTWEDLGPGLSLQVVVDNLLDEEYFHPGVSAADGTDLASRLPQNGRALFLRLVYER